MNHELLAALLTSVLSSTGGVGAWQWWLTRKQKEAEAHRDKEAKDNEDRRAAQAQDSQTWYRESRNHYEVAKEEAADAKKECASCRKELHETRQVIYQLLEDLEDKVLPMFLDSDVNPIDIRVAMRATIKTARESL